MPLRIIALLACHNRKALTIRCLESYSRACHVAAIAPEAILLDDASTDGTGEAVTDGFDWVRIIHGDGSLHWNRAMHRAFDLALHEPGSPHYLFFLNDDVELFPDALTSLLQVEARILQQDSSPCLVVGSTLDQASGEWTYGGLAARSRLRRFAYVPVWHESEAIACQTMNGNAVLIPLALAREVGNLDPAFEHALGDIDYGLRVREKGFRIFAAPGHVGYCSCGSSARTFLDTGLALPKRWRHAIGKKGLPPRSWLRFTRRHGGIVWPLYFLWPYLRLLASGLWRGK